MLSFFETHDLYVVLVLVLIVWFGLLGYLVALDRRVGRLEARADRTAKPETQP